MKPSKFIGFTILILAFFLVGNTGWAEEGVKDKYAPAPKTIEGWVEYPELIPSQTERDPDYNWLPKGPFPYKPSWPRKDVPNTGEELYFMQDYLFWAGKYTDMILYTPIINKRGLVTTRNLYIRRLHPWDDYNDVLDYDRSGVVGLNKEFLAIYSMLDSPPEMRGFAQLMVKYLNAPGKWKDPDRYAWVPALRRVRRSAGGDRQDDSLGYPFSNDDNGERQPWEYDYWIIGEDVVCESAGVKGNVVGEAKSIVDNLKELLPAYGVEENPYREDGCVECYVTKMVHKYDPKYYLGQILVWTEKYTKQFVRMEQYDREGSIWKIYEMHYDRVDPGGHIGGGYPRTNLQAWDIKRDFRTYAWYGDVKYGKRVTTDPTFNPEFFTIPQLQKEYFWRKAPDYRPVTKAEHFPPYPPLYAAKKAKDRKGFDAISKEFNDKVKSYQDMWDKRGGFDAWGWAKRTKYQDVK